MSVLLDNSETWTLKRAEEYRLRVFEMSLSRRICSGLSLRDIWRNEEIKSRIGIKLDIVEKSEGGCMERFKGNRPRGRLRTAWTDVTKEDCAWCPLSKPADLQWTDRQTAEETAWCLDR